MRRDARVQNGSVSNARTPKHSIAAHAELAGWRQTENGIESQTSANYNPVSWMAATTNVGRDFICREPVISTESLDGRDCRRVCICIQWNANVEWNPMAQTSHQRSYQKLVFFYIFPSSRFPPPFRVQRPHPSYSKGRMDVRDSHPEKRRGWFPQLGSPTFDGVLIQCVTQWRTHAVQRAQI